MSLQEEARLVANVVYTAGGQFVGKTRLQKTIYLLQAAGWNANFNYRYHHYGPYSESLSDATNYGILLGFVKEEEKHTKWGGYSVYSSCGKTAATMLPSVEAALIKIAADADSVELELAATALYLHKEEKIKDPWTETEIRKTTKAKDHLNGAKKLYKQLQKAAPKKLPVLL